MKALAMIVVATLLALTSTSLLAQRGQRDQLEGLDSSEPVPVHNWKLMTESERLEFHQQMQAAETWQDRQELRAALRAKMQARAEAQGVTLRNAGQRRPCQRSKGKSQPSFVDFDANGDGVIGPEEFQAGHAQRFAERAQQGRQLRQSGSVANFRSIDTDADGQLSPAEFAAHQAERRRLRREQSPIDVSR